MATPPVLLRKMHHKFLPRGTEADLGSILGLRRAFWGGRLYLC